MFLPWQGNKLDVGLDQHYAISSLYFNVEYFLVNTPEANIQRTEKDITWRVPWRPWSQFQDFFRVRFGLLIWRWKPWRKGRPFTVRQRRSVQKFGSNFHPFFNHLPRRDPLGYTNRMHAKIMLLTISGKQEKDRRCQKKDFLQPADQIHPTEHTQNKYDGNNRYSRP